MKYIFLDIDGTLVDFNGKMPDSARCALQSARRAGNRLIINTGRNFSQIYEWLLREVEFDGFITSSGAKVVYQGRQIFARYMSRNELEILKESFEKTGAAALYHTNDAIVATRQEYVHMLEYTKRKKLGGDNGFESLFSNVKFCEAAELPNIEKAVYFDSSKALDDMRELVGANFHIDTYSMKNATSDCGELTLTGVDKAAGIGALIDSLGVSRADTIAIGDGGNDLDMIKFAGIGVAMGNACAELKSAADMVCDDISRDGIAKAFAELKLTE